MLFNDFLLLTRIKRRFITKIFQIIHQKLSKQSSIDWFDSFHTYLIVYKQVK